MLLMPVIGKTETVSDKQSAPSAPTREILMADTQKKLSFLNNQYRGLTQVLAETQAKAEKIRSFDKNHVDLEVLGREESSIKAEIHRIQNEFQALSIKIAREEEKNALLRTSYALLLEKKGYKDSKKRYLLQECKKAYDQTRYLDVEYSRINQELSALKESYVLAYADQSLQHIAQELHVSIVHEQQEYQEKFSLFQKRKKEKQMLLKEKEIFSDQNTELKDRLQRDRKETCLQAKNLYEEATRIKMKGRAVFDELFFKSTIHERKEAHSLALRNQDKEAEAFLYMAMQEYKKGILEKHSGKIGGMIGFLVSVLAIYKFMQQGVS